jgi:hypothetical protein
MGSPGAVWRHARPIRPWCATPGRYRSVDPCYLCGGVQDVLGGQHAPFPADIPHFEAVNPWDAITSCPPDSPLRDLADAVSAFGLAMIGGWTRDIISRMRSGRFQPASFGWWRHPVQTWALYGTAEADIAGYLTGEHTTVYIQDSYCARLAATINHAV